MSFSKLIVINLTDQWDGKLAETVNEFVIAFARIKIVVW